MSGTAPETDITFPRDYWDRQSYYRLDAVGRAKVDVAESTSRLASSRYKAISMEIAHAPISIHPDWVSLIWEEVQGYRGMSPKNEEDAAELEVALTRVVVKAIAEGRATNPQKLGGIISGFRVPNYES